VILIPPSIAAYAAMAWVRVLAVVVLALGLLVSGYHFGAKMTRADWEKERAALAAQHVAALEAVRTEEHRRAEQAQAVLEDQARREAAAVARAVAAERSVVSLRNTIAQLNARPAPGNPEAAGYADEARVARELLGSCSARYTGLAAEADGLREQVIGLQQWVSHVTQ
jgi:hypothetical protein